MFLWTKAGEKQHSSHLTDTVEFCRNLKVWKASEHNSPPNHSTSPTLKEKKYGQSLFLQRSSKVNFTAYTELWIPSGDFKEFKWLKSDCKETSNPHPSENAEWGQLLQEPQICKLISSFTEVCVSVISPSWSISFSHHWEFPAEMSFPVRPLNRLNKLGEGSNLVWKVSTERLDYKIP